MSAAAGIFEVGKSQGTFVLTSQGDLRDLDPQEGGGEELLRLVSDPSVRHVVVDLARQGFFGPGALSLFLRLWRQVRDREGRMALCNVPADEEVVLAATGLVGIWPVYPSREQAIQAVAG
jgi:anti-anti-sigma factor